MPVYACFDLILQLPFSCPALPLAVDGCTPDVSLVDGLVPQQLPGMDAEVLPWQAAARNLLFRGGPRSGRFLVQPGQPIILQRGPKVEEELLAFHFLNRVLPAILRQRGHLVLHADACVGTNGQALAVAGVSGAGKSTTLAALLNHGYRMFADDLTVLRLSHNGELEVLPGIPQFHLTEEAAQKLGRDIRGLPQYQWRRMKAAVPALDAMAFQAAALRSLFILKNDPDAKFTAMNPLNGAAKFAALQECLFGPVFPVEHTALFALLSAFVDQVKLVEVTRPDGKWTVDEVVGMITSYG